MAERGTGSKRGGAGGGSKRGGTRSAGGSASGSPGGSGGQADGGRTGGGEPDAARAAKAAGEAVRSWVTLPLGELVPGVTRAAYRRRSPAGALLLANWERVVGPRLAGQTTPLRLIRGVLTIGCAGPVAMELQHLSGSLIERINAHAGEALVTGLRFQQTQAEVPPPLPAAAKRRLTPVPLPGWPDSELSEALARLLAAISAE